MPETYAIILGSGLAGLFADARRNTIETDFGRPSADIREAYPFDRRVLGLPRHGDDHTVAPHRINYRANIQALKALGADAIIGLNTVGAIRSMPAGGELALPHDLIDRTWGRAHTYFDATDVQHIEFAPPFDGALRNRLLRAANDAGVACRDDGVMAVTQGPRLETAAEVDALSRLGVDYVGMTAMPEASLAAELSVPYACLAIAVNAAAGRGGTSIHAEVSKNSEQLNAMVCKLLDALYQQAD